MVVGLLCGRVQFDRAFVMRSASAHLIAGVAFQEVSVVRMDLGDIRGLDECPFVQILRLQEGTFHHLLSRTDGVARPDPP
jgi:hypothetical protein